MDQKLSCGNNLSVEAYVRGMLTPEQHEEVERHLASCASCREAEQHVRVVVLWEKCRQEPDFTGPGSPATDA